MLLHCKATSLPGAVPARCGCALLHQLPEQPPISAAFRRADGRRRLTSERKRYTGMLVDSYVHASPTTVASCSSPVHTSAYTSARTPAHKPVSMPVHVPVRIRKRLSRNRIAAGHDRVTLGHRPAIEHPLEPQRAHRVAHADEGMVRAGFQYHVQSSHAQMSRDDTFHVPAATMHLSTHMSMCISVPCSSYGRV